MPYELTFRRQVAIATRDAYINECCVGGDVVLDQLLPSLREAYSGIVSNQEDWGWFAWFEKSGVKLAVDIFTMDAPNGEFQILVTSRRQRLLLGSKVHDTPELERLRQLFTAQLETWPVVGLEVERVDAESMAA